MSPDVIPLTWLDAAVFQGIGMIKGVLWSLIIVVVWGGLREVRARHLTRREWLDAVVPFMPFKGRQK